MTGANLNRRRKQERLNLTYYPNIFLEALRKITKYLRI
jgi:hypothetical protein